MKSSNRWLIIFGAVIFVLVVAAVVLVLFLPPSEAPLAPEGTPEGTVQRYLLALEAEDFPTAWGYLSPPASENLTYDNWLRQMPRPAEKPGIRITLRKSSLTGNQASVEVVIDVFRPTGPFDNPVSSQDVTFFLTRIGTSWKITSPTYVWWFFY